ncbi:MAG: hypothetical protein WCT25_01765 [Candidatus Paceibacterota bacterium]
MSIKPNCDFCKKGLTAFGGILLSPPRKTCEVKRFHICKACFKQIVRLLKFSVKEIEDILSVGPAWLNYTRKIKRKTK